MNDVRQLFIKIKSSLVSLKSSLGSDMPIPLLPASSDIQVSITDYVRQHKEILKHVETFSNSMAAVENDLNEYRELLLADAGLKV